jgi:acyl-coenzyme A synthetase/AMP-(fatty) acid ligase
MDEAAASAGPSDLDPERIVLFAASPRTLSRGDLERDVLRLRTVVPRGGTAVVTARHSAIVLAALVALDGWAARVELRGSLEGALPEGSTVLDDSLATSPSVPHVRRDSPDPAQRTVRTVWRLFSSGTTGEPTATDHTFESLASPARRSQSRRGTGRVPRRWALLYQPTRMAGVQVLLQAWCCGDKVVDAMHLATLESRLEWLASQRVDAISATPTLWWNILRSSAVNRLCLSQITLGGEIATQPLLDALARTFDARITHVYASTEAAAAFAVSDGLEGFPVALLGTPGAESAVEMRDGMLYVRAAGSAAAGEDGFVRTGDLVELHGDRVYFLGRDSGVVNVGGEKVSPERVEHVIRQHPEVADVVVTGRRNAFSGAVLTARVVTISSPANQAPQLPAQIRAWVAHRLPPTHVPATVELTSHLEMNEAGKVQRR